MVSTLQNLFTFTFVLTSMLSMGLSLTVSQIIQPLRSTRLVIMALAANFVIVPAVAFPLKDHLAGARCPDRAVAAGHRCRCPILAQARSDRQGERGVRLGANDDADGRDDSL